MRRELHRHPELGLEEHRTQRADPARCSTGARHPAPRRPRADRRARHRRRAARAARSRCAPTSTPCRSRTRKDVPYRSRDPGQDARLRPRRAHHHPARRRAPARASGCATARGNGQADLPAGRGDGRRRASSWSSRACSTNPKVEAIFGLHVDPGLPVGRRSASSTASATPRPTTSRSPIHGRSCHGAYPAAGVDAHRGRGAGRHGAADDRVSRNVDARQSAVVTLGTIHGGTQGNIVAPAGRDGRHGADARSRHPRACAARGSARSPRGSPPASARAPRSRSRRATTR